MLEPSRRRRLPVIGGATRRVSSARAGPGTGRVADWNVPASGDILTPHPKAA